MNVDVSTIIIFDCTTNCPNNMHV